MDFLETRLFDEQLLSGTSGGPRWSTTVVPQASGREQRTVNWSRQRARYDVGGRLVDADELTRVVELYNVAQGMALGFRWRDIADHRATRAQGLLVRVSAGVYQLHKRYSLAGATRDRKISKPNSETFALWVDGVPSDAFALDTTTGQLTTSAAGVLEASFEFDIPVRFDTDELSYTYEGGAEEDALYQLGPLPVVELKL